MQAQGTVNGKETLEEDRPRELGALALLLLMGKGRQQRRLWGRDNKIRF